MTVNQGVKQATSVDKHPAPSLKRDNHKMRKFEAMKTFFTSASTKADMSVSATAEIFLSALGP